MTAAGQEPPEIVALRLQLQIAEAQRDQAVAEAQGRAVAAAFGGAGSDRTISGILSIMNEFGHVPGAFALGCRGGNTLSYEHVREGLVAHNSSYYVLKLTPPKVGGGKQTRCSSRAVALRTTTKVVASVISRRGIVCACFRTASRRTSSTYPTNSTSES